MAGFYVYLISSLPMLHFGAKPPFSFERFLETCQDKISAGDIHLIKSTQESFLYTSDQSTLKQWYAFDTAVRNELAKIRASSKHLDPLKHIRGQDYIEPYITRVAMSARRNPSILEAERLLDQERWRKLDELALGHYFDLDFLICYALKLLILERWERVNTADRLKLLNEVLN